MTVYRKIKLFLEDQEIPFIEDFDTVSDEVWVTYAGFIKDIKRGWIGDLKFIFYDPFDEFDTFPKEYEQTYHNVLCKRINVSYALDAVTTVKYIFEKE